MFMDNGLKIFSERSTTRLCVVTGDLPAVSETFIRGHIDGLPTKTILVHSWPPSIGDKPVLSLPTRVAYKIRKRIARNGTVNETTAAYFKAFQRWRADVVLAEYGTMGVLVMEACRKLNVPLVVHFHGYDASVRHVLEENAETYPAMFKQAAAVIAVSRAMRRKLVSLGAPAERVFYNPCGVDCGQFTQAEPVERPAFLAVGRFVEKKAPHLTLKAFAEVYRTVPEARLRMIGDGPLLDACRKLTNELGIDAAVVFLGAQPHEVVAQEMRRARCFVQHSLEAENGDCEGTPVGILEAGASGLPVVSTRHAGIQDVIIEGRTGFLVEERDVPTMASYMIEMAKSPDNARQLGINARAHVS